MRALVLLAVLAPEASQPAAAIAWHPEARVSTHLQQRLRELVAEEVGVAAEQVEPHAIATARHRVARDIPRRSVERVRELGDRLDRVEASFRGGELEAATRELESLRTELEAAPELPGISDLARREALLTARVHWARADADATDRALSRVLTLDPRARLSPRDVPPALAARYVALQDALLASEATWPSVHTQTSSSTGEPDTAVELVIDGVPGHRPVPPGPHFLVAHRPGRGAVAAFRDVSTPWILPEPRAVLPEATPAERETAERMCESLAVGWIVLAHAKDERVGLEAYRCGAGFGPRWVGDAPGVAEGVRQVLGADSAYAGAQSRIDDAWPRIVDPRTTGPDVRPPPKKPWYKRAWVWVVVGGVVVGGVTTGVVLGTQGQGSGVGVNADDFLRP